MKIGIYNIYTTFVYLLIFFCGGVVCFFAENIFNPFKLISVFAILVILITLLLFFRRLYKFRFLIISDKRIASIRPFLLKKQVIKWSNLGKIDFNVYYGIGKSLNRTISLSDNKVTISYSDLEFENFETLTKQLPNGEKILKEINLDYKHKSKFVLLEPIIYSIILLFMLYQLYFTYPIPYREFPMSICFILLYASIKRIIWTVNVFYIK